MEVISRFSRSTLVFAFFLLLLSCSGKNQEGQPYKLPSGRVVRVLSVMPIHFAGGASPALMLRYQTDLKVSDMIPLRNEVDDIWTLLRIDAEKGNFTSAIISANEVPQGVVLKNGHAYNFVYEKRADGAWHCLDDDHSGSK